MFSVGMDACHTQQVDDVDELKQRLAKVWRGLRQSVTRAF